MSDLVERMRRAHADYERGILLDLIEEGYERIATLEAEAERRNKNDRYDAAKGRHCCCRFEEDDETPRTQCSIHAALKDEVAKLREEAAGRC